MANSVTAAQDRMFPFEFPTVSIYSTIFPYQLKKWRAACASVRAQLQKSRQTIVERLGQQPADKALTDQLHNCDEAINHFDNDKAAFEKQLTAAVAYNDFNRFYWACNSALKALTEMYSGANLERSLVVGPNANVVDAANITLFDVSATDQSANAVDYKRLVLDSCNQQEAKLVFNEFFASIKTDMFHEIRRLYKQLSTECDNYLLVDAYEQQQRALLWAELEILDDDVYRANTVHEEQIGLMCLLTTDRLAKAIKEPLNLQTMDLVEKLRRIRSSKYVNVMTRTSSMDSTLDRTFSGRLIDESPPSSFLNVTLEQANNDSIAKGLSNELSKEKPLLANIPSSPLLADLEMYMKNAGPLIDALSPASKPPPRRRATTPSSTSPPHQPSARRHVEMYENEKPISDKSLSQTLQTNKVEKNSTLSRKTKTINCSSIQNNTILNTSLPKTPSQRPVKAPWSDESDSTNDGMAAPAPSPQVSFEHSQRADNVSIRSNQKKSADMSLGEKIFSNMENRLKNMSLDASITNATKQTGPDENKYNTPTTSVLTSAKTTVATRSTSEQRRLPEGPERSMHEYESMRDHLGDTVKQVKTCTTKISRRIARTTNLENQSADR